MEKKYLERWEMSWANINVTLKSCFDAVYAPIAKGVTGGDSHAHTVGDGGTIFQARLSEPVSFYTMAGWLITLTANETQALGDVCYIGSDGKAHIAKADVIANASAVVMCIDPAGIAASASGNYIAWGRAKKAAWSWTVGGRIYLSVTGTTGNTLTQTAPSGANNVIQCIGVALAATEMLFMPSLVQIEHV